MSAPFLVNGGLSLSEKEKNQSDKTYEFRLCHIVFIFMVSSFCGWLYETIYTSIQWKEFAERGFLQLPLCPIYGFGAIVLLGLFGRIKNVVAIFLAGTIVTTLIELGVSYILEYVFHMELWTYRHWKYNYQGRIALGSSILFGVLTVFLIKLINPAVSVFLKNMNCRCRVFMSALIVFSIVLDTILCLQLL